MWVHRELDFEALRALPEYADLQRPTPAGAGRGGWAGIR
jgi:hypothetical protein